jgi:hypothetical protein
MCGTAAIVSSVSIKGKRWVPSSVLDPDPSLFCKDPDPDPSINKQKQVRKNLDFFYLVIFLLSIKFYN